MKRLLIIMAAYILLICFGAGCALMNEMDWARLETTMANLSEEEQAAVKEEMESIQEDHEQAIIETVVGIKDAVLGDKGSLIPDDLVGYLVGGLIGAGGVGGGAAWRKKAKKKRRAAAPNKKGK